jgi:Methyltransferase domain
VASRGALNARLRAVARRARRHVPVSRRRYEELARQHHEVVLEANHLRTVSEMWVPPGHFYSPFPDLDEVERRASRLWDIDRDPTGIDLREQEQLALFDVLADILEDDLPFPAAAHGDRGPGTRYYFENPAYSWSDGMVLHALLRHLRPRRVVEVGSGYSSAMTLDTTERWLDDGPGGPVALTFIEPYTELLRSLLRPGDEQRVTIHEKAVQDVPVEVFEALGDGDVLFVDSTHVVKAGSDVNHLMFEVFPRLAPGVWIHVHDIFFPFEYPHDWVREGRAWHEVYLLRALMTGNDAFEIRWFQSLMWARHRQRLEGRLPAMAKNAGGNIWLQKVR